MALRLVLGRAGTGKTRYCLEAIARELRDRPRGPTLILLVPEQATFQMEQALLAQPGIEAFERAHVLGFRRLAWRVLQEVGGNARPAVGELGKLMVLRALLARRGDELRLFGRVADRPGFIHRLARTVGELRSYGKRAEDLRAGLERLAAEGADDALAGKLHDLALVLDEYERYLEGRFSDPDDQLTLLARRLGRSRLCRGARVWVDGFTGFTPQELAVLQALMAAAEEVVVTLCLDPDERPGPGDGAGSLFAPTRETRRRLERLAVEVGVPLAPDVRLAGPGGVPWRFRGAPVIAHLEREFFRREGRRFEGEPRGLRLVAARDRRFEVEAAAREILRLVRDEGLRYREVAVVVRDLDDYHDLIRSVFAQYGIPAFIDRRRPVPHHPLVELVRSALEVVIDDWPYEAVFRYLKTDLVPVDRDDVDLLENYVLAFGIRGRRWYDGEPWTYRRRYALEEDGEPPPDPALDRVNRARTSAAAALSEFHARVAGGRRRPRPVHEFTAALYELLERLGVPERLQDWSRAAEAAGDLDAAQEHLQVWNGVVELLDQTVEALGDVTMTLDEYLRVLEAGLEGLEVGLIPPGLDQVVVGTVERSRHPSVRAALLLGMTDRAYPRAPEEDVVFSDAERERLEAQGFDLAPSSRERLLHEPYFAYLALTRAGEHLYLSHPLAGEDGRALAPSPLLRRVHELVPGLEVEAALPLEDDAEAIATPAQLAAALARRLRRAGEGEALPGVWAALRTRALSVPELRAEFEPVLAALRHRHAPRPLPRDVVRDLYGASLEGSISRLERFAACPFQHFAAHGLRLREREVFRLEAPHLGVFYHAALRRLHEVLEAAGVDWAELDEAAVRERVEAVVAELAPRLQNEILFSSGRHRYLLGRIRRTLTEAVALLVEHARRGRFRPAAVEAEFGPETPLGPVPVELSGEGRLLLRGRIDRIDVAPGPAGRRLVRVIDYKSGRRDLDLARVYHGLALQLAVYLLAVVRGGEALAGGPVEPAGLLYFPVEQPLVAAEAPPPPDEAAAGRRRRARVSGLVLADVEAAAAMDASLAGDLVPVTLRQDGQFTRHSRVATRRQFEGLFRRVVDRARELGEGMLAGEVAAEPYRFRDEVPCPTCPYHAVCQFDPLVPGSRYRGLPALPPEEVLRRFDELAGGGGGDG